MPNMARVLERAGYTTYLKGKWHLSQPVSGGEWSDADRDHLAEAYGFHDWPAAGCRREHRAVPVRRRHRFRLDLSGYDEDFARSVEAFLADPPPEPWALVVSLVNPHDVLGYPDTWEQGGYQREDWQDLDDIELPPSFDENVSSKPSVHPLFMKMGQNSFLGAFESDEEKLDYCRFYAHLHRLSDEKIRRVLDALGDPDDPESLRSKTVIVRTSDHGELGMSHGGLRQKAFNAYDETLNVPFIVSNPVLFPEGGTSEAHVSLVDIMPTMAGLAGVSIADDGARGHDLTPVLGTAPERRSEVLAKSPVEPAPVASNGNPVDPSRSSPISPTTTTSRDRHSPMSHRRRTGSGHCDRRSRPTRSTSTRKTSSIPSTSSTTTFVTPTRWTTWSTGTQVASSTRGTRSCGTGCTPPCWRRWPRPGQTARSRRSLPEPDAAPDSVGLTVSCRCGNRS